MFRKVAWQRQCIDHQSPQKTFVTLKVIYKNVFFTFPYWPLGLETRILNLYGTIHLLLRTLYFSQKKKRDYFLVLLIFHIGAYLP